MDLNDEPFMYFRDESESGIYSDSSLSGTLSTSPPSVNWINPRSDSRRDSFNSDRGNSVDEAPKPSDVNPINDSGNGRKINEGPPFKIPKPFCFKHREELRYYCSDCEVRICRECTFKRHRRCRFKPFHAYAKKLCQSVLDEDSSDLREVKTKVMEIQKSFESKIESVKETINNAAAQIISDVEERKNDLFKKLENVEKVKNESWKRQLELCDFLTGKINDFPKTSDKLNFKDVNALRKSMSFVIGNELGFIEDEDICFKTEPFPNDGLGKIKMSASPKKTCLVIGNVSYANKFNTCTVIIKNHMDEIVTDSDFSLTASLTDKNNNFVNFLAIKNLKNGTFNIMYYPTEEGLHFLRVYLNSVPIGNSPRQIRVVKYPNEPKIIPKFIIGGDNGELLRPWGICGDSDGRIIITDRGHNCLKIFDGSGSFLFSFGREGCGPGEFSKPAGVAVDRYLRRIVVADKDNNRVQVFGYAGNFLFEFGRKGEKNGTFYYPWDVSVSPRGLIAVSDSKNRRVQIFDSKGNYIRKFSFNVKEFKGMDLPRGVAFKSDGSLMVTDFNKHKVILLSRSFETVKELGSVGTELNRFFRPQSVDVNEKGYFAVSDCKNHRVQVFSPSGKLFRVFGTFGKDPGEMDSPQGIAFLPEGRIGIVELGNNRVQIFEIK